MDFNEMSNAVRDARLSIERADRFANDMASLIAGRLRISGVSTYTLCKLKRELQDFNMHTKSWKEEQ